MQGEWDLICSDLSQVPLSRAAAASSAVPLVLSPVTINNYGGTCGYREPSWVQAVMDTSNRARPAGRALQRYKEMKSFQDSAERPFCTWSMAAFRTTWGCAPCWRGWRRSRRAAGFRERRGTSRLLTLRRIVVFVVNSLSVPKTDWDRTERPPNDLQILLKATGAPIDRYSYESVELLKDMIARWRTLRAFAASGTSAGGDNPRAAARSEPAGH